MSTISTSYRQSLKSHRRLALFMNMIGSDHEEFWLVTPPTGDSRKFKTTKDVVKFLKDNPGSLVSWRKAPNDAS